MIVVDASALLELLLRTRAGDAVSTRVFAPGETLHAPSVVDVEVLQVLRRHEAAKEMTRLRAQEALDDFRDLPLERYPHAPLLERIWDLRHAISAYDAAYVALAEALDAPLLTCDAKLSRTRGHRARIEAVSLAARGR